MKVGFIALGKLGLPCAVATALKGHDVMGYDIDPGRMTLDPKPELERDHTLQRHYNELLSEMQRGLWENPVRFGSMQEVCDHSEIIFVSVQTPHEPRYEGITRLPEERVDFNYTWLRESIQQLAECITRPTVVIVISTVLPGNIREHVLPYCNEHMKLCYNPFFIAMGTTMRDFLHPEFVLFGHHDSAAAEKAEEFYQSILTDEDGNCPPFYATTIENAELIKVAYNTYIGMKIVWANTLMEICHKMPGCDVDQVTGALKLGSERLISTKYMNGGMGDGGGCHPRDNIALSWLARKLDLSRDIFEDLMLTREAHSDYLRKLMWEHQMRTSLPIGICGYAFKAETNLTIGSPALLLEHQLIEDGNPPKMVDHHVHAEEKPKGMGPHVWLIGCNHPDMDELEFDEGSVVLDPWRMISPREGVEVIPIGVGPRID